MKTLIAYASKTGTAQKCAEILARLIPDSTVCNIRKEKLDPSRFDAVIVGGGIRAGQLNSDAKAYLNGCEDILVNKRLGLFICSMDLEQTEKYFSHNVPAALLEKAVVHMSFGGEYDVKRAKGFDKMLIKMLLKMSKEDSPIKSVVNEEIIQKFAAAMLDIGENR